MQSGQLKLSVNPDPVSAQEWRQALCRMTFALVKNALGEVQGSVSMARDVTERVEAEKAARKANA